MDRLYIWDNFWWKQIKFYFSVRNFIAQTLVIRAIQVSTPSWWKIFNTKMNSAQQRNYYYAMELCYTKKKMNNWIDPIVKLTCCHAWNFLVHFKHTAYQYCSSSTTIIEFDLPSSFRTRQQVGIFFNSRLNTKVIFGIWRWQYNYLPSFPNGYCYFCIGTILTIGNFVHNGSSQ